MSEVTQETSVTLNSLHRSELLRYGSGIATDSSDAASVIAIAEYLAGWLKQAEDADDLQARYVAMDRQHGNHRAGKNDADRFIEQAKVYYEFAKSG